jgi:hypothetical protein
MKAMIASPIQCSNRPASQKIGRDKNAASAAEIAEEIGRTPCENPAWFRTAKRGEIGRAA